MAALFDAEIERRSADESIRSSASISSDVVSDYATEFEEWANLPRTLRIVTTGKTGVGKSSLLNGFVGEKVFTVGNDFDPGTLEVNHHKFTKNNVEVTVWDCPGLQDGTPNEGRYLQDLKNKTNGDIDIMLYCISMEEVRLDGVRHADAMKKLTNVFERRVWKNTVIVLTFANRIVNRLKRQEQSNMTLEEKFEAKVEEWKNRIQQLLRDNDCTDEETLQNIQVVPAGFKKPSLPGRKYWLSNVWIAILETLKTEDAQVAAISLNAHRFRSDRHERYMVVPNLQRHASVSEHEFNGEIEDHPIVIRSDIEVRLRKVCSVIGAVAGCVTIGVLTFGIALDSSAYIGSCIGGEIGSLMFRFYNRYKNRRANRQMEIDTAPRLENPEVSDISVTRESTSGLSERSES